jgi:hypothetical protein
LDQASQRHSGLFRVGRSAVTSRDACEVAHPGLPHGRLVVRLDDLQHLARCRAVHLYAGQLGGAFAVAVEHPADDMRLLSSIDWFTTAQ